MIYDITRLRYIENRPLSLERSHLPAYLFPLFLTRDLTTPFYTMFERDYGVYPCNVDETLESVVGDEQENELLQIEAGTPLMRIHRIAYASNGCPFERATDVYIADRMRFTMHHSGYVRLSATSTPVSYTHLDVYKRQGKDFDSAGFVEFCSANLAFLYVVHIAPKLG